MEKVKKFVNGFVDFTTLTLPIGWVLACYNGAMDCIFPDDLIKFLIDVFCACLISSILIGFGLLMSGQTITKDKSNRPSAGKWAMLGIEIFVIILFTGKIISY